MLEESYRRFLRQCLRANETLQKVETLSGPEMILAGQMVFIRLQDDWSLFVRSVIYSSATGRAKTITGHKISSSVCISSNKCFKKAIGIRPNDREPNWHIASEALEKLKLFGTSNERSVASSLGSASSPEKTLRAYRNYLVHRYDFTARRLRLDAEFTALQRPEKLSEYPYLYTSGGKKVYESWLARFRAIALIACKDP